MGSHGGQSSWREQLEFCSEVLQLDGSELSFEEIRAQRMDNSRQLEKLQQLRITQKSLSDELKEKKKLLSQLAQGQTLEDGAGPEVIDSEATSSSSPLQDEVYLRPFETNPRLPHATPESLVDRPPAQVQMESVTTDQDRSTSVLCAADAETRKSSQTLKSRNDLSPIEEASDSSSLVDLLAEGPAPPGSGPNLAALLLEVTSHPDVCSYPHPAPAVEEFSYLDLGDQCFQVQDRLLAHQRFCVYGAIATRGWVIIKVQVSRDSGLWDFHMIQRLKSQSTEVQIHVACFLFQDGCITVFSAPPSHMISVLQECVPAQKCVQKIVMDLLQLVALLKSAALVHGDLQSGLLLCCRSNPLRTCWFFPLDWYGSVDLDLHRDVVSLQQLPAAHAYIRHGLAQPTTPAHQVDLMGVAQIVHLLLTGSQIVPAEDASTTKNLNASAGWYRLYQALLSAGPSESDLTEVLESFNL